MKEEITVEEWLSRNWGAKFAGCKRNKGPKPNRNPYKGLASCLRNVTRCGVKGKLKYCAGKGHPYKVYCKSKDGSLVPWSDIK